MIKLVTQATFESEVLQSAVPVIVDYGAAWCGKCKMLSKVIDQVAEEYAATAKIVKVNVEAEMPLAQRYNVTALPTLIFFKGGEERSRITDLTGKDNIVSHLRELL